MGSGFWEFAVYTFVAVWREEGEGHGAVCPLLSEGGKEKGRENFGSLLWEGRSTRYESIRLNSCKVVVMGVLESRQTGSQCNVRSERKARRIQFWGGFSICISTNLSINQSIYG